MVRAAAALVSVLTVVVLSTSPTFAKDTKEEAKERFEKGVSLFKEGDFEGALVEFRAAYTAEPHFAVRYNIGITLYKLHRYGEASTELNRYLQEGEGKVPEQKHQEVEAILAELESLVGSLEVDCNVAGAEVHVDGEYMDKVPFFFPLQLDVGEHRIEVKAEGYETFAETVEVPGGKEVALQAVLVPLETASRKKVPSPVFWSGVGLTGALALTATITGGVALKKEKDYRALGVDDAWRPAQRSLNSLALGTDVLWGLTGAVAITTLVVAFFTDFKGKERTTASLSVSLAAGDLGLQIRGVF